MELAGNFLASLGIGNGTERCKYGFRYLCVHGAGGSLHPASKLLPFWEVSVLSYLASPCSLCLASTDPFLFLVATWSSLFPTSLIHLLTISISFSSLPLSQNSIAFVSEDLAGLSWRAKESAATLVEVAAVNHPEGLEMLL